MHKCILWAFRLYIIHHVINATTPSPTMYPTISRVTNPCRINSCAECASQWNCVWCGNSCVIDGEICYDENFIQQEFACPDFEPVTNAYFDQDYSYKYNAFINLCRGTYNKSNSSNGTDETESEYINDIIYVIDYDADCHNMTYELTYWIDFADNITSEYTLIGQVTNIQQFNESHQNFTDINDTLSALNSSLFIPDPPCQIKANEGVVNQIICPKDLEHNSSALAIPQQDILFTTLRYLLPRLESTLFHKNDGIINEIEANGNVKMKRDVLHNSTNEYGYNVSKISTGYRQSDYDEYYGTKLKDKKVRYETEINPNTSDVSTVQFQNTFIMADMGQVLLWNSFRYKLRLITKNGINESVVENLLDEINYPDRRYSIQTYQFTIDQWRGLDPAQEKTQTIPFSNTTEQEAKQGYQDRYDEEPESTRRRLEDGFTLGPEADIILALFDNKEHFMEVFGFEVCFGVYLLKYI